MSSRGAEKERRRPLRVKRARAARRSRAYSAIVAGGVER